ncbi:MAG TPA: alanine racemase [Anaerolineaceae bacterium]|nr:alanine racemase [Anaerolineaceae bacterium]
MTVNGHLNWVEIDLGAIGSNTKNLHLVTGRPVMVVVKGNAYGHGMVEAARAAEQAGAEWCAVARMEEALVLRQARVNMRILVLGYTAPSDIPQAIANDLRLSVFDRSTAEAYAEQARASGGKLRLHLKIDTGMGRLGIFPEEAIELIRSMMDQSCLEMEGIFTHLARAGEGHTESVQAQLQRFDALLATLSASGLRPPLAHAANSAAALYFPQARYDLTRCGIAAYGLPPIPDKPLPAGFRPALTWKARLISLKTLPAGHGVSFGHRYTTQGVERVGVVATGYADGFRRSANNRVVLRGKCVPVIGAVCMDQCMVQLDEVPDAQVGDEVVIIGATLSALDVASAWGTIPYDVICGLAHRVTRIYV